MLAAELQSKKLLKFVFFTRLRYRILILLCSFLGTFFGLMGPFFQKQFVDLLTGTTDELTITAILNFFGTNPLFFLIASFVCILLTLAFSGLTNFLGSRESIIMQRKLSQALYDKTLTLRSDSLQGRAVGELVSVYAVDVPGATTFLEQSLPVGATILFPLILAPISLVSLFHLPALASFLIMAFLVALNLYMAYRQAIFFFRFKSLAAQRVGIVSEWIQNIRTLRILGWISAFEKRIQTVRLVETDNRITMVTNGQAMNAISSSVTFLINIAAISYLALRSPESITPGTLLALLWVIAIFLTRPFRLMPWFFTFVFDSWTSLKRIGEVLELHNIDSHSRPDHFVKLSHLDSSRSILEVENLDLHIGNSSILKNISLQVKSGEFVTLVGEVGSGKSMLLLSLLGETGAHFGKYQIGDNDALNMPLDQLRQFFTFVPQEGFIMSGSLRENVGFEYDLKGSDDKILASLERAQFSLSQDRMEAGLDTEIGERGVNLSGGQRQRISLARVDFYNSPIVLLDDCLSALDVDTEEKLLKVLLQGEWKNRTRILATHRLSVLKKSDRVVFLKDGQIADQGRFFELLRRSADFRDFAASVERGHHATE